MSTHVRFGSSSFALAVLVLVHLAAPAVSSGEAEPVPTASAVKSNRVKPLPCASGRYQVTGAPLTAGQGAPTADVLEIGRSKTALPGICGPVPAKRFKARRRGGGFTRVRVKWDIGACAGFVGRVRLTGKLVDGCTRLEGRLKARKFRQKFEAQSVPLETPVITSISPTQGPIGTEITIIGENFGEVQGDSVVTFNSIEAVPAFSGLGDAGPDNGEAVLGKDILMWSDTEIVAKIPAGAVTGDPVLNSPMAIGEVIVSRGTWKEVTLPRFPEYGGDQLTVTMPILKDSNGVRFDTIGSITLPNGETKTVDEMIVMGRLLATTATFGNELLWTPSVHSRCDGATGVCVDIPFKNCTNDADCRGEGVPFTRDIDLNDDGRIDPFPTDLPGGFLGNPEAAGLMPDPFAQTDLGGGCPGCGRLDLAGPGAVENRSSGYVGLRAITGSDGVVRYGTNCAFCHAGPDPITGMPVGGMANPNIRLDWFTAFSEQVTEADINDPISPSRKEIALLWGPGKIDLNFQLAGSLAKDQSFSVPNHTGSTGFTRWFYVGDLFPWPREAWMARRRDREIIEFVRNFGAVIAWGGTVAWTAEAQQKLGVITGLGLYMHAAQTKARRLTNPDIDPQVADRGRRVFEEADLGGGLRCADCHSPHLQRYTNGMIVPISVVGTDPRLAFDNYLDDNGPFGGGLATSDFSGLFAYFPGESNPDIRGYRVPKLVNLFARKRFLHDGALATLEELFETDRLAPSFVATGTPSEADVAGVGVTGHLWGTNLSAEDKQDLVEFLKTL